MAGKTAEELKRERLREIARRVIAQHKRGGAKRPSPTTDDQQKGEA